MRLKLQCAPVLFLDRDTSKSLREFVKASSSTKRHILAALLSVRRLVGLSRLLPGLSLLLSLVAHLPSPLARESGSKPLRSPDCCLRLSAAPLQAERLAPFLALVAQKVEQVIE
jgi:hypothetical protein